ncbi:hypothetical protein NWE55_01905 [Myroides albus]|uniref:hypothetical protein n=1 Tax=Myroides albus TaxID=2562892 RepID=UPI002158EB0B|nr:hypothetical protein [Myroides albus]UVD80070.1 hypothetical protein NWE55_01905 [Myroides albus]
MAKKNNTAINSGVENNVGMGFQKHCTLYLLLENYHSIKERKYFIILEHLEDIIFGYLDEKNLLTEIETFQAKKSTNKWSLNKILEILKKIAEVSQTILEDPLPKSSTFFQTNYFATNNTIELKSNKISGKTYKEVINETNISVKYSDLDSNIKNKILEGNTNITFSDLDKVNLETLTLQFVDLARTPKSQIEHLYGKSKVVFGETIQDHKASIDTLLKYLDTIDSKFNQGGIALLGDVTKRIESAEINQIFNILTTKKLAYDFWREKEADICKHLKISFLDRTNFKLHYLNSFDNFKDLKESEHKKIYDFVLSNKTIMGKHFDEKDCIMEFIEEFNKQTTTTFRDLQLKAVISAAFVEINNTL